MKTGANLAEGSYQQRVQGRIEALMSVLAKASIGDYSHDVPQDEAHDEFSELYVGVQLMLETVREKVHQLEGLNEELENIVAARSAELFGSETRFSAVADSAPDAIITTDARGHILYVNRAAEIIFGYPESQLKDQALDRIVPGLGTKYLKSLPTAPSSGTHKLDKPVQAIAEHKRGRQFPVELSFATWKAGQQTYVTAVIRDLTVHQMIMHKLSQRTLQLESQVAEQTLLLRQQLTASEHNQAQVEAMLSSLGEGVVAVDKTGRIVFVNHEMARLAHTESGLVNGQLYSALSITDATGRPVPRAHRPIYRALKTGQRVTCSEYFYHSIDDQLIPVSITAAPVMMKGKIVGGIDIIRDISKEKEADRLKSEFVSLASHQLRTPATAVKGLLSLILEGYSGEIKPSQRALVNQAYLENEHELKLVDDMLDAAKLDAGEILLEPSRVNLRALLKAIVAEQQSRIRERHQVVIVTAPHEVSINADAGKLQMVFENLITNACKYSADHGRITVRLSVVDSEVVVRVRDRGIGIPAQDIHLLFRRFSRAANAAKAHTTGSGLGLYLAKKIVDLHHGKITLESQLGRGSTFTVTLPKLLTKE